MRWENHEPQGTVQRRPSFIATPAGCWLLITAVAVMATGRAAVAGSLSLDSIHNPKSATVTWSLISPDRRGGVGVTSLLDGDEIAILNAALDTWASVSGLTNLGMIEDSRDRSLRPPDPGISRHRHLRIGTRFLDGPGGVLAATKTAKLSRAPDIDVMLGLIRFDADEQWVDDPLDPAKGVDLYTVAVHHFGLALGLEQVESFDSVMYPKHTQPYRTLHETDVSAIQAVYGPGLGMVPLPAAAYQGAFVLAGLAGWQRVRKLKQSTAVI